MTTSSRLKRFYGTEKAARFTQAEWNALTSFIHDAVESPETVFGVGHVVIDNIPYFCNGSSLLGITSTTPELFGAVASSQSAASANSVALKLALESGRIIDGLGQSFYVAGTITPTSLKGLRNITLIQTTQSTTTDCRTLNILNIDNFILENVTIDRGTNPFSLASGSPLNYVFGLFISGTSGTYCKGFTLRNVNVTGHGAGNGIGIWWAQKFSLTDCYVHDMNGNTSPAPADDCIQGIWLSNCQYFSLKGCEVSDVKGWNGSSYTNRYSRGFAFGNIRHFSLDACIVDGVEQGIDLTGTGDSTDTARSGSITGCIANSCGTSGIKLANACHDLVVSNCTVTACGWYGFVVSGQTDPLSAVPQHIDFVNCQAINIGIDSGSGNTYRYGFCINRQPDVDGYQPRSIRFIGCSVKDTQVSKTTAIGFVNEVYTAEYPVTGYNENWANQLIACHVDKGITFSSGITPNLFASRRNTAQTIATGTYTAISWNDEVADAHGLHNPSNNSDLVYIKTPGWYSISARVTFTANATGGRLIRIEKSGSTIAGSTTVIPAISGMNLAASTHCASVFLTSGDTIAITVYQNSGGNLDTIANECLLEITKIDG